MIIEKIMKKLFFQASTILITLLFCTFLSFTKNTSKQSYDQSLGGISAPYNLECSFEEDHRFISLDWEHNSSDIQFQIYRSQQNDTSKMLNPIKINSKEHYKDPIIKVIKNDILTTESGCIRYGTIYYYAVKAYDKRTNSLSAFSNIDSGKLKSVADKRDSIILTQNDTLSILQDSIGNH